jgi:hypothetical protein
VLSPKALELLTKHYEELSEIQIEAVEIDAEDQTGSVETQELIINADQLWADIKPQVDASEFFLLMVDGMPGSGKSSIARELGHKAHNDGFKLLYASGFNVLDAPKDFIEQGRGFEKICIVLDDMSYALNAVAGKDASAFKNFFSLIRHALKARVFVIVIAHFTTAVPPIFKNSNVWIFSAPTTQEYDWMMKIVGRKQTSQRRLQQMFQGVTDMQAAAKDNNMLEFDMYGNSYKFQWGVKGNPGDGRLMLLLQNGTPKIYNSKYVSCEKCKHIGVGVEVDINKYLSKDQRQEAEDAEEDI